MAEGERPASAWRRRCLDLCLVAFALWFGPGWLCGRQAGDLYRGDVDALLPLARQVADFAQSSEADLWAGRRHPTDNADEWNYAAFMLAGMGLAQFVEQHPACRDELLPAIDRCVEQLLSKSMRAAHRAAWGADPIVTLETGEGQVGYLGYLNLLLGQLRVVDPANQYAHLNDRITAALKRRLTASPIGLIETYPGMTFPCDVAAAVGSLGLHARATGADHAAAIRQWVEQCRQRYIDRDSGLLLQQVRSTTGETVVGARSSGTNLAVWFLSFADPELSRQLFLAMRRERYHQRLGFGVVFEQADHGDATSYFFDLIATGFGIAGCRIHGDAQAFRGLCATSTLLGAPQTRDGRRRYLSVGPTAETMMFATLTAVPR